MKKPFTIGITGGSGSGKTFFLKNLESRFTSDELCLISQDHYYHPREMQQHDERGIKNFDLPESIDHKQFQLDIQTLKRGEVLKKKEYTFNNPNVTPKILEFRPAPVIIVEGLFVQYFPDIERELDLKIFIEAKDHVKLSRRIKRDNEERGYDLEDVLYRYENHVMPVYETLIKPLKHRADIVIPNNSNFNRALDFLTLAIKARITG
ncbi:MAG TPA: P-loop NTPase fold protein [Cyclobacteriaceae bacterium]|nr:P-loop NTPase fold protein [Cyclobacteriaceae bacterium]